MLDKGIADRYARALAAVATSREAVDKFDAELDAIIAFDQRDPSLLKFLSHPKIEIPKKKEVVRQTLGPYCSTPVLSLLLLMIDKKRGGLIIEAARRFSQLADEIRGVEKGVLITAVPISDDLFTRLQSNVQRHSQRKIILERKIDGSIIGGAIVKLGNLVIDGSIRHRLQHFREEMLKVRIPGA